MQDQSDAASDVPIITEDESNKYIETEDWSCSSVESCKTIISIIGILSYWQNITNMSEDNINDMKDIFKYLSSSI